MEHGLHPALCRELGIRYPIFSVGFGTAAVPQLVAAVSNAGGDVEYAPLWAGESCNVVNDIKPAAEIVRDLVRDAEAALAAAR